MPGTKDEGSPLDWFEDTFGFPEHLLFDRVFLSGYQHDKFKANMDKHFSYDPVMTKLTSKINEKCFYVGDFEVLQCKSLSHRQQVSEKRALDEYRSLGDLTFSNEVGSTRQLILDKTNAKAVFQVTSLFNCLESVPIGCGPMDGVASYAKDASQGTAAALACPAATVFRNYFHKDCGQLLPEGQIDCLRDLGEAIDNAGNRYWMVSNGYCLPKHPGSIAGLSMKISQNPHLEEAVRSCTSVGVHWDTAVAGGSHRVCQVFCSALPVAMVKHVRLSEWSTFAKTLLEAMYDATLSAAGILAAQRSERVKVFLTLVGGGGLGNRRDWIVDAIERALIKHAKLPLDIVLVHFQEVPQCKAIVRLERHRVLEEKRSAVRTRSVMAAARDERQPALQREISSWHGKKCMDILRIFEYFDMNGDGYVDRTEFTHMLHLMNPEFFTPHVVELLIAEADANADDEINYVEFARWLTREDDEIYDQLFEALEAHTVQVDG